MTDCYEHAKERAYERYDVSLSLSEYEEMCADIDSGSTIRIEDNGGNPQRVVKLRWHERDFYVVWSEVRSCITTFLPQEHFSKS